MHPSQDSGSGCSRQCETEGPRAEVGSRRSEVRGRYRRGNGVAGKRATVPKYNLGTRSIADLHEGLGSEGKTHLRLGHGGADRVRKVVVKVGRNVQEAFARVEFGAAGIGCEERE